MTLAKSTIHAVCEIENRQCYVRHFLNIAADDFWVIKTVASYL